MKNSKITKVLALALTAVLSVGMLAGCGGGSSSSGQSGQASGGSGGTLTMGTGGESGTYYAFGGVLANYIGQNTDIKINVVSSGGSAANISDISNKTVELATVQSDVMTYAFNGTNSFAESGAVKDFRVLGGLYAETVQIITCDPSITSVADLKGKNVCVGDVGSGTYYNTIDVLTAYDMTIDDIKPIYQSFGDSAESLKDGKIDAAFLCAGAPTTAVTDLALTIPAGTYATFNEDATTITVKATLICSADLPEDTAYTITKTIYEGNTDIAALHAKGEELSTEFATESIAVPFHAGAAKYFAEKGLTVESN